MNMYVSNLNFQLQEKELEKIFSDFGEVVSAKIITDRETGRSKGYGFVEMKSNDEANQAMSELNNKEFDGRRLSVSAAREREKSTQKPRW